MRYLMHLRNIFRRHGLIAITAIVLLAGPTRADRFPPDPVEELHQFLQLAPDDLRNRYPDVGKRLESVKPEDYQAAFEKERDRLLAERIKAVRTIPEMRRALLLQEWRLDQVGEAFGEVEKMNRKYRNELAQRFQEAVGKVVREGNLDSKLAALNMLAELGVSVRTPKEPNGIGRAFEKDVADLSKRGQTSTLRETAARTLGQIFPDPEVAVPALQSLLEPSHSVPERRSAAYGLFSLMRNVAQLAAGSNIAAGSSTGSKTEASIKDVVSAGQAVVPAACNGLTDPDPEVRRLSAQAIYQAAAALPTHGPHPPRYTQVSTEAPQPQQEVAHTRDELKPLMLALKEKASLLRDALGDRDPDVRMSALRTLEEIGTARQQFLHSAPKGAFIQGVGDPLLDTLKASLRAVIQKVTDPRETVRLRALDVLETLGPDGAAAIPTLVQATADPSIFVRWAAARVLREIGPIDTARTVPALARLLTDVDLDVGLAAARALERYGPSAKAALPDLIRGLKAGDPRMRQAVIASLEGIGTDAKPAIPALSDALADPDLDVRRVAAEAIGKFGPAAAQAEPALRQALDQSLIDLSDPNERVREAASKVRQAVSDALLSIASSGK